MRLFPAAQIAIVAMLLTRRDCDGATQANALEARAFWSRHVAAWMRGPFNQREYGERHSISRPLLEGWRIWLSEDCARGAHQDCPMPPPAAAVLGKRS